VTFRQNIGAIVLRFHRSVSGQLCQPCIGEKFREMTLVTFLLGWWGIISFFATPFIIVSNIGEYLGARSPQPRRGRPIARGGGARPSQGDAVPLETTPVAISPAGVSPGGTSPAGVSPAGAPPAGPRKGLAVASVVTGLFAIPTCGLLIVGGLAGFIAGLVAFIRARRSPAEYAGAGLAMVGMALNAFALLAPILWTLLLGGLAALAPEPQPGQREFRAANRRLVAYEGQTAFGNTPEARGLAERFGKAMDAVGVIAFEGEEPAATLTENRCLTWCEIGPDTVCFLAHVPRLRSYQGEAREALLDLAWSIARDVTRELREPEDRRLGVGLRGVLLYGAVAVGLGESPPAKGYSAEAEPGELIAFFGTSTAPTASTIAQGETVPAHPGIVELVPGRAVAFDIGDGYFATSADFGNPMRTRPAGALFPVRLAVSTPPEGVQLVTVPRLSRWLGRAPETRPLVLGQSVNLVAGQELRLQGPGRNGRARVLVGGYRGPKVGADGRVVTTTLRTPQLDVDLQPGLEDVGAPLLDAEGRVVGMVALRQGAEVPIFVPVEHLAGRKRSLMK
jgi:hypothetical protein